MTPEQKFSRKIILHFHLFKNAGTSVDVNLRRIFGDDFLEVELGGPADYFKAQELIPVLEEAPDIRAVSSHTLCLPVPTHDNWLFFPIIILRHPLDRILSMYTYEKAQDSDSPGSNMAKRWEFPEYVARRLDSPEDVMLHNWQTGWLARNQAKMINRFTNDEDLFKSAAGVLESLPFIGVVERFPESLFVLNHLFSRCSIPASFKVETKNRSQHAPVSQSDRFSKIRMMIGVELYEKLERANALDIRLHRLALDRILDDFATVGL